MTDPHPAEPHAAEPHPAEPHPAEPHPAEPHPAEPHPAEPHAAEPFAAGREADVFALDDRRVLRRYRTDMDATGEAEVMAYVGGLGYPVPKVFEANGPDLVMERLDGPTMAQAMLAGTFAIGDGATMLARLLRRLHELPPWDDAPAGTSVVHLDLHPENVILTADGPMVIDWRNAGVAPADLDTAFTALILAQVAIGSLPHPLVTEAGNLLDAFLREAPGDPTRLLDDAVAIRTGQATMSPDEVSMLGAAAARVRGDH
jgi:aminoglycoside phosphotransferase (APT) family kinase protein